MAMALAVPSAAVAVAGVSCAATPSTTARQAQAQAQGRHAWSCSSSAGWGFVGKELKFGDPTHLERRRIRAPPPRAIIEESDKFVEERAKIIKQSQKIVEQSKADGPNGGLSSLGTDEDLASRILSGQYTLNPSGQNELRSKVRQVLARGGALGRLVSLLLAKLERKTKAMNAGKIPEAKGNVASIVNQPFFVPLYALFQTYGSIFRLTFGPKSFIIVSDPDASRRILKDNAKSYSKGILAEILEFVMGKGLIPADWETWKHRRRAIVPSMHKKFVAKMLNLFGQCSSNLCDKIYTAAIQGGTLEMENLFSRMTLDVIGKAVFNYEFNALSVETGIMEAVYVALREAEARSTSVIPYWKLPCIASIDPRQRKVKEALKLINGVLDSLIANTQEIVNEDHVDFSEDYVSDRDPSILNFLLAAGDDVTGKQLRDDLMTLLIAGHETSAAVLTWTFYLLALNPAAAAKLQMEVDAVLGDREPNLEDLKKLRYANNVISESMRLYPQPPVLIRRALENDMLGSYKISKGDDIFISTWNLHRSPTLWDDVEKFLPDRWESYSAMEASQNYRYLPFGAGPRKCLGDVFATHETVTALVMLMRRFNFELAPDAPPVSMTTGATIHTSNGLHMAVTLRTKVPVIPVENGTSNGSVKWISDT